MMTETVSLGLAWAAGGLLGAVFFGGLWWSVRRGLASARPALWFAGSLVVRAGIVLSGFYLVADGDWRRLLLCLLGFVMMQLCVGRLSRASAKGDAGAARKAPHAP